MLEDKDAIVVGSGFCGSIIARKMAEEINKKVVILEKRNHIAGNMYDEKNEYGIIVQKYGPHTIHTNNKQVFDYICEYGEWAEYKLECMVYMDGKFTPSPFNFQTIDDYFNVEDAERIKHELKTYYNGRDKATIVEMLHCDNKIIKNYAQFLFDKDYSLYTAKQWGISPDKIDISVLQRVPVLFSYKTGYFDDTYQVMPKDGFTGIFEKLLDHDNISVILNKNATTVININTEENAIYINGVKTNKTVVFTGAIDELLNYKYGVLPYRSLRFDYETHKQKSFQNAPVVAYPQEKELTRITEYTKIPYQSVGEITTVAKEYPVQFDETNAKEIEPYYPIINNENVEKYNRYLNDIKDIPNLYICGRLADYKYYNMDNAIERAFDVYEEIKKSI